MGLRSNPMEDLPAEEDKEVAQAAGRVARASSCLGDAAGSSSAPGSPAGLCIAVEISPATEQEG